MPGEWTSPALPDPRQCGRTSGVYVQDRVSAGVALHHEPGVAAGAVVPELAVRPGDILPQIDIVEHRLRIGRHAVRPHRGGVAQHRELVPVALAAIWTGD